MEPIYRVDGATAETSAFAGGPWDPKLQHGAAPSSLICWAVERLPSPAPMRVARLTVDLMRPVPVAPLTIETELLREGRKIQLVSVRLLADGTEVVRATVLRVRRLEQVAARRGRRGRRIDISGPEDSHDPTENGLSQTPFLSRPGNAGGQGLVPHARPGGGVVSRDAADRRRRADLAADARRHRRRFLQRHLGGARLHASGPSSTAT